MKKQSYLEFNKSSIGKEEIDEIIDTLHSGWITMGPKVQKFEARFAKFIGVKYAVAVHTCTAALHLALLAHGIGPGDEVLVPSFTFVSTVNVILQVGATPVFVDISEQSMGIDPGDVEKKITKKTKAIIVVHFAGLSVDLDVISKTAKKHHLIIIEDAAHAAGSKYNGKYIGTHHNTACFSFYATKNLTTGEGGMLTTDDSAIADYVTKSRLHGISRDAWKRYSKEGTWRYDIVTPGFKYNMTDMQAALGLHQLTKLPRFIKRRQQIAAMFDKGFADHPGIQVMHPPKTSSHAYHLYPIQLLTYSRDKFIDDMKQENIGVSVHFIPVHQFTYYKKHFPVKKGSLEHTDAVAERIASLPLYPAMTDAEVKRVIRTVKEIVKK
jgi:dTDP-4-amino-4,6-dideoxygalactose transaminase